MIKKILIANRGEIALRILRTCKELDIKTVAVYSTIDKNLLHVKLADETICIGPPNPNKSYLNINRIIAAAELTAVDAIHPGYGFLSENYLFAEAVEESGFIFIGPNSKTIKKMGNKFFAIQYVKEANIECLPGASIDSTNNMNNIMEIANNIGYPIIIKPVDGGGGRGMRIVYNKNKLLNMIKLTSQESQFLFNNKRVYIEKYLEHPRHIEIQVLGDGKGNAIHLFERDCSIQRRNQKIIEEAPSFILTDDIRKTIGETCVNFCKLIKYKGVGTFEFLYHNSRFYFIEINPRIQVEHPITEMITNVDIIKEQILIYSSESSLITNNKNDIKIKGHSIECRINAENTKNMLPSSGKINFYHPPGGPGVRIDTHIYNNYYVPHHYDSMIAKLIVYANNRTMAIKRLKNALDELIINGIETNISLHKKIINHISFNKGKFNINFLDIISN